MAAGVARERIWLDPGIGFGKTAAHNLALTARLDRLVGDRLSGAVRGQPQADDPGRSTRRRPTRPTGSAARWPWRWRRRGAGRRSSASTTCARRCRRWRCRRRSAGAVDRLGQIDLPGDAEAVLDPAEPSREAVVVRRHEQPAALAQQPCVKASTSSAASTVRKVEVDGVKSKSCTGGESLAMISNPAIDSRAMATVPSGFLSSATIRAPGIGLRIEGQGLLAFALEHQEGAAAVIIGLLLADQVLRM